MRKSGIFLLLFFGSFVGTARGQTGVINMTVTSTPVPIVVNVACTYVVIQENSASPANAFTITLPGSATGITYPAGNKFIFTATAGGYQPGMTIGTISIPTGSANFVGIESIAAPTVPSVRNTGGGGGGAGNPASPDTSIQINKNGLFGSVPGLNVDNSGSPTVLDIGNGTNSLSLAVSGPRPWTDVTAFGADPSGVVDATTAIQNAINAACNSFGVVLFPPGSYTLTQPQTPSTSPIFTLPCGAIQFRGGGGTGASSSPAPQATLNVHNLGASPNATPVFSLGTGSNPNNEMTFENLQIIGCNQDVFINGSSDVKFKNVTLSLNTGGSCNLTDHYTLVDKSFWFEWFLGASNGPVLVINDNTGAGPYDFTIDSVRFNGGNIVVDGRSPANGNAITADWVLRNITLEASTADFLIFQQSTGTIAGFAGLLMDNIGSADASDATQACLNWNVPATISRVSIRGCGSGNAGQGVAIRRTQGTLGGDVSVMASRSAGVVDASGNAVGNSEVFSGSGIDAILCSAVNSCNASKDWLRTENIYANAPGYAGTNSGNSFRTLAISPDVGYMLNGGGAFGYSSAIGSGARDALDVMFASPGQPVNIIATPTTGGSLSPGSYTLNLRTTGSNCGSVFSAPVVIGPVTVNGPNNAIQLNWTQPLLSVGNTYCLQVGVPGPNNNGGIIINGATSFLYTGQSVGAGSFPLYNSFAATHRFTPNALGINTTNPQFSLDVTGTARITSTIQAGGNISTPGGFNVYLDSGTANTYIINEAPFCPASLANGSTRTFQALNGSTGPSTLNDCSLGALTIKKGGGTGANTGPDIANGDIKPGQWVTVVLATGTPSIWECMSCGGTGSGSGTVSTTGNPVAGELAGFSAALTITNTNLTGDVTTSNTTQTTLAAIQGISVSTSGVQPGQILTVTPTPSYQNVYPGVNYDAQSSTYTIACPTDRLGVVDFTGTSATSFTLPQAGATACMGSSFAAVVSNHGTATLTLTATTSTIDTVAGATGVVLLPGSSRFVYSDNINFHTVHIQVGFGGINLQTGSYTPGGRDFTKLVVMNCTTACTFTLPNPPPLSGGTTSLWNVRVISIGSSLATISLNGLTFNGNSAVPVLNSFVEQDFWTDTSNYFGSSPIICSTNVTCTPASNGLSISATSSGGGTTTIQTNGVSNASQTTLNLQNTTGATTVAQNITWTNPSGGNDQALIANVQGTDTKLLTSGAISGTAAVLCTDANAGATTSGCPTIAGGVNAQTAGYTLVAGDSGKLVTMNGSNLTATLPSSPPSATWYAWIENLNATSLTIARNGLTINGGTSNVTLLQYQWALVYTDNSNYFLRVPDAAGNGITLTSASNSITAAVDSSKVCVPGSFAAQTDGATVTWAIGNAMCANASLTFTTHGGNRTLNITNPVNGGSYVIWLKQDGTGGEGLTLGTGCTWKVVGGGAGAITLSSGANAIDVLAFTTDGTNCYANLGKNFN